MIWNIDFKERVGLKLQNTKSVLSISFSQRSRETLSNPSNEVHSSQITVTFHPKQFPSFHPRLQMFGVRERGGDKNETPDSFLKVEN